MDNHNLVSRSAQAQVSHTPLPDGTIFDFRFTPELIERFADDTCFLGYNPAPQFALISDLLLWFSEIFNTHPPQFIKAAHIDPTPAEVTDFLIYHAHRDHVDGLYDDLYIYVWAITPAGGAA